jgi:hypothetical protein
MAKKATINTAINSAVATSTAVWGSTLMVHANGRLNVSIKIGGSLIQDPTLSTCSALVHLQRRFGGPDSEEQSIWRDVESWAILAADALDAGSENITTNPEPETCEYRIGVKAHNFYEVGALFLRVGSYHGEVK